MERFIYGPEQQAFPVETSLNESALANSQNEMPKSPSSPIIPILVTIFGALGILWVYSRLKNRESKDQGAN